MIIDGLDRSDRPTIICEVEDRDVIIGGRLPVKHVPDRSARPSIILARNGRDLIKKGGGGEGAYPRLVIANFRADSSSFFTASIEHDSE